MTTKPKRKHFKQDKFAMTAKQPLSAAMLLELLSLGQKPLRIDQILRVGGLARKQKKLVEELLYDLMEQEKVLRLHGGQWVVRGQVKTLVGRYSIQRSGAAFVDMQTKQDEAMPEQNVKNSTKSKKNTSQIKSVFIHPSQAGDAWHGDLVRVAVLPGHKADRFKHGAKGNSKDKGAHFETRSSTKAEGRIIEIIERQAKELTVRVIQQDKSMHYILCKPADVRFAFTLRLDSTSMERLPERGELILAKPTTQLASNLWEAQLVEFIGFEEDVRVQEDLVKLNHEAPSEFPASVFAEISGLAPKPSVKDLQGREDLSQIPFVTIDGETARDFDDAIYVQALPQGGWCLQVGIADVTHYMQPFTALDKEAQRRGNSWYFPRSVEPMLPAELSNGLCSLNPHENRLIMLAELHIDAAGMVQKSRFSKAFIRSHARLTYTQVKALVLDRDEEARQEFTKLEHGQVILNMLEQAELLARVLAKLRLERGCLDFHLPEAEYIFDERGRITDIIKKQNHFAHQMIEEFMIAANEAVARFLAKQDVPFLYRIHPEPDPAHLDGLFRTLQTTPLAEHVGRRPNASNLQSILHASKGSAQEFLVSRLTLRTMPQARYFPENAGHFGLASTAYCHFTSPIRRYADVVVHRALKYALELEHIKIPTAQKLVILGDKLNRCERAAIDAEREMAKRLAVLMLQDRIGEGFDGIICGVSDFGIFVEFNAMPVEGMIRIRDLGDDYFEYDPERQELTGIMHGQCYKLGQNIRTRLIDVNLGRLEITLGLVKGKRERAKKPVNLARPIPRLAPKHKKKRN